jgi:phosphoribosylanthranilate isomerase
VNPTETKLLAISKAARLDVIQLHKIPADWTISRELFPAIEFWKAGALDDFEDQALPFNFDRYLIDSYDPKTIGGTGQTCDWTRAKKQIIATQTPTLLAGGLNPSNVAEAIHRVAPWGIDVSSGVEIAPGEKDLKKVAAFITAARAAG